MTLELLEDKKYNNLLDAGFGSGIFLPELAKRCDKLVGIDAHNNVASVKQMSKKENINAELIQGNLLNLPFKDSTFDCVVSISVLEFVYDVESVLSEIRRVSREGAKIVVGAPVLNHLTDHLYNLIGFKRHKTTHKSDQNKILDAAQKFFTIKRIISFPNFLPLNISLFFVTELMRK